MSEFTSLEIVYAVEDVSGSTSDDSVTLEQAEIESSALSLKEWIKENGKGWSLDTIAEYFEQKNSLCASDGHIDLAIYAYKSRPDLIYKITASYGNLVQAPSDSTGRVERVNIAMASSYTIDGTPTSEVSASWDGVVYDAEGVEITPLVEVNGNLVTWGGIKVLGTLVLKYNLERDVYTLTLFPREEAETDSDKASDAYASTVTAFWDGGFDQLETDIPDLDSYCRQTGRENQGGDDGDKQPCYRKRIIADGCTKEKLAEIIEEIPCPEDD